MQAVFVGGQVADNFNGQVAAQGTCIDCLKHPAGIGK